MCECDFQMISTIKPEYFGIQIDFCHCTIPGNVKPTNKYPTSLASRKIKNTAALIVIALVFTGCFQHYFRTNTQASADPIMLDSLRNSQQVFYCTLRRQ